MTNAVTKNNYIGGLDGMRAMSVISVIIAHAGFTKFPGSLGVTVFFFISGFLITTLLLKEMESSGTIDIKSFYARRYFRLTPELYAYVIITTIAAIIFSTMPNIMEVIASLFYFTNYLKIFGPPSHDIPFALGHFWSLAVEEHFYLTWPLCMYALVRGRKTFLAITALLLLIGIGARFGASLLHAPYQYLRYASECRIDSIAYGALFSGLLFYCPAQLKRLSTFSHLLFIISIGIIAAFTFGRIIHLEGTAHEIMVYSGQGIGLLGIFTYIYANNEGKWCQKILEIPILRFIGRMSYGIYIWHFLYIYLFTLMLGKSTPETLTALQKVEIIVATIIISTATAWLSAEFILKPFNNIRARFGSHVQLSSKGAS